MKRLLAIAVAAGLALAILPARATPLACADPCEIDADWFGYVPAAVEIASGTDVLWVGVDDAHPTADSSDDGRCFVVRAGVGVDPTPVRFTVDDGALFATTDPGTPEAITAECAGATRAGGAAFVLSFRCLLHPWMHGALTVPT